MIVLQKLDGSRIAIDETEISHVEERVVERRRGAVDKAVVIMLNNHHRRELWVLDPERQVLEAICQTKAVATLRNTPEEVRAYRIANGNLLDLVKQLKTELAAMKPPVDEPLDPPVVVDLVDKASGEKINLTKDCPSY